MLFKVNYRFWLFVTLLVTLADSAKGAKILALFPHSSENHFALMRTVVLEMVRHEHNVTLYTGHRLDEKFDYLQEHTVETEFEFWNEVQKWGDDDRNLIELAKLSEDEVEQALAESGSKLLDHFLSHKQLENVLQLSRNQFDFDLIVVDLFYTDALLAFGYYFQVPIIGILNSDFANYMDEFQDRMVAIACRPYDFANYNRNWDFWKRVQNIRQCLHRRQWTINIHYTYQNNLVNKFFGHINDVVPSVPELHASLTLLLVNNYFPLAKPRATLTNIISVGGVHIRTPRELPWHIKRYIDEARTGLIYMYLGDYQLCSELSQDKLNILYRVLGRREERVLWTCHDIQKLPNQPENFLIQHMVPQTDILAHPHVKLFITNGDLLGLQEGIVRHVPLLGLPLFRSELKNCELIERLQIGLQIDYTNITEISLEWALHTLLHNEFFVLNIREVTKAYRDRPLGGLATAMFWLDYILRYGGASLRSQGMQIPLNHLHLQDLLIYYMLIVIAAICGLIAISYGLIIIWRKQHSTKLISKLR